MIGSIGGYGNVLESSYISKLYATGRTSPVEAIQKRGEQQDQVSDELSLSAAGLELAAMLENKPEIQPVPESETATTSQSTNLADILDELSKDAAPENENTMDEEDSEDRFSKRLNEKIAEQKAESESDFAAGVDDSNPEFGELNGASSSETSNETDHRFDFNTIEKNDLIRYHNEIEAAYSSEPLNERILNPAVFEDIRGADNVANTNNTVNAEANSSGRNFSGFESLRVASAYAANSNLASNQFSLTQLLAQFSSRGG